MTRSRPRDAPKITSLLARPLLGGNLDEQDADTFARMTVQNQFHGVQQTSRFFRLAVFRRFLCRSVRGKSQKAAYPRRVTPRGPRRPSRIAFSDFLRIKPKLIGLALERRSIDSKRGRGPLVTRTR